MKFPHFLAVILTGFSAYAASEKSTPLSPSYRVSVDAKVMSHFIDRGLSMSNGNPAMNVSFLYNFGPQFRLGFWGSNISKVSSEDDNFWFKFLADVRVDFSTTAGMNLYIHDDHYYKSDVRNGQSIGVRWNWNPYLGKVEWMNNFQGTKTNATYINIGRLWPYKMVKVGGKLGYTLQSSETFADYFDFKVLTQYNISTNSILEGGITAISNSSQFGDRGKFAFYISVSLSY